MFYYKVPVINGVLDINYAHLIEGFTIGQQDKAAVKLITADGEKDTWEKITEEEFISLKPTIQFTEQETQLDRIETTLDLLLLKQEGII